MRVIWGDKSSERSVMPAAGAVPPGSLQDPGQREWLGSRWEFEDERFERHALRAEFATLLDRVGETASPVLRIFGAERLAEVAQRRPVGGSPLFNPDGLPFYLPAARVLAALLILDEQPEVRHAARLSLNTLIEFGRQGEQTLLYALIPVLADCNRSCLRSLRETLGRYLAKYGAEETTLPPLVPLLRLTGSPEATLRCLESLAESAECQSVRERHGALRVAQAKFGEPSSDPNNHLLETLCAEGARLTESRDILANALRELHAPPLGVDSSEDDFIRWRGMRRLTLEGVCLAGGELSGVSLPGAVLVRSHLEGANLEGANLIACELRGARLAGAELYGTLLEGDPLPAADLKEADWWNASAASWRGAGGESQRRWLQQHSPEPIAPLPVEAAEPLPVVAGANPLLPPLPAPRAAAPAEDRSPGGTHSAAQKIAELKRKSQKKSGANGAGEVAAPPTPRAPRGTESGTRTDPRRRENAVPATVKDSGRGALPFTPGKVILRDKALPNDGDILSESDLMEVTDLMTEAPDAPEKKRPSNALAEDDGLTDEDLLEIEDLLKKPK